MKNLLQKPFVKFQSSGPPHLKPGQNSYEAMQCIGYTDRYVLAIEICYKESERLFITGVILVSGGWRGVEVQLVGVQLAAVGGRRGHKSRASQLRHTLVIFCSAETQKLRKIFEKDT